MSNSTARFTRSSVGMWIALIGIVLGIIGIFWNPVLLGIIAVILGVVGLLSPQRILSWLAIIAGVIALISALF